MKVSPMVIVVAAAVVVIAALVFTRPEGTDVARARAAVLAAVAHSQVVERDNHLLKVKSDSSLAIAAQAEKVAALAQHDLASSKAALFRAARAAPDTCGPVVVAAQAALADADKLIDARTTELANAIHADSVDRQRADHAEQALLDLSKPAVMLAAATETGFLSRLKHLRPQLFAGVVGGVDITGKPSAVAGVGFGWQF